MRNVLRFESHRVQQYRGAVPSLAQSAAIRQCSWGPSLTASALRFFFNSCADGGRNLAGHDDADTAVVREKLLGGADCSALQQWANEDAWQLQARIPL